jgi:hypothetical protein
MSILKMLKSGKAESGKQMAEAGGTLNRQIRILLQ